jgi:hypothetical protein
MAARLVSSRFRLVGEHDKGKPVSLVGLELREGLGNSPGPAVRGLPGDLDSVGEVIFWVAGPVDGSQPGEIFLKKALDAKIVLSIISSPH